MHRETSNPYNNQKYRRESEYIHKYYLSPECRKSLQPPDVAVIYAQTVRMAQSGSNPSEMMRKSLCKKPFTIFYKQEGLVKTISPCLLDSLISGCLSYLGATKDASSLSDKETLTLIELNHKLCFLEQNILRDVNKIFLKMQNKQLLHDVPPHNSVEVVIQYALSDKDSMTVEYDENILYEHSESIVLHPQIGFNELKNRWLAEMEQQLEVNNSPFGSSHCYLFHDLINFSKVPIKHICRIVDIWVELRTSYLRNVRMNAA